MIFNLRDTTRALAVATALGLSLAAPEVALAQQAISLGGQTQGALSAGDTTRGGGQYTDVYSFTGRAGQRVRITQSSSEIDSYLTLTGPNNFSAENDDDPAGGTLNSALEVTLPVDGQYRIGASSFRGGVTGRYTLAFTEARSTGGQSSIFAAGRNQSGGQNNTAPAAGGSLNVGQNVSGDLRQGDAQLNSGEFVDSYTFRGRRGQQIDIRLEASDFDPYLMLRGPGGYQEDNDDDAQGGGLNSRILVTLPQDGDYRISATSYAPGATGRYRLSVGDGAGAAPNEIPMAGGRGAPLAPGQNVSGVLQTGDAQLQSGEFVDTYRFLGQRGQRIVIEAQSSQFDTYLILRSPAGAQEDNDDGPNGTNARIETVLAEDGEYAISATSYQPGESGAYTLSFQAAADGRQVADADVGAPPSGDRLTAGRAVQGRLQSGDAALRSGEFVDSWTYQGRAGQTVSFDMRSSELDSYLMVVSPSGEQMDNDDAEGGVRDARVTWRLPESGVYQVRATSYAPGESGAYALSVSAGGEAPGPGPGPRPPSQGGGRVYAVMVGISDYAGLANNLAFTADDARNLAQTMRADGVLAPESVILTDRQATRANVRAAFQRVAAAAGPDDLFLFFYSGHGSQTEESSGSPEADRRDETIVMVDGEISDDEVAQWFNQVNARMAVIALDSCFSGGFARDVVNRPGVMGLFSSEEDLTSSVASKFRAGGYLSHFLRTGFDGEADEDGDRAITAGELSTYLWRKFATEVEAEEAYTSSRERNYQRLVVDRGGVKIDDVVLAL